MMNNNEYDQLLKDLDFIESTVIKKDLTAGKIIAVGEYRGTESLLKVVPKQSAKVALFEIEKKVDQILMDYNKSSENKLFRTEILNYGNYKNYFWSVRRYYVGNSLAELDPKKSMLGYDILRENIAKSPEYIVDEIANNLSNFRKIKPEYDKFQIGNNFFHERFQKALEDYNITQIEKTLDSKLNNQLQFYNKNKSEYFEQDNISASIGDLTPANILILEDDKVAFFDFELFNFDNYSMDVAYLWLFLWRYPVWQGLLIKKIIASDKDRLFFRMSVIRILFLLYDWPYCSTTSLKTDKIEFLRNHIWTRYIAAAGESYEKLISIR